MGVFTISVGVDGGVDSLHPLVVYKQSCLGGSVHAIYRLLHSEAGSHLYMYE